eukprot:15349317-Ditylum_brightwellii.AAC.1
MQNIVKVQMIDFLVYTDKEHQGMKHDANNAENLAKRERMLQTVGKVKRKKQVEMRVKEIDTRGQATK